MNTSNLNLTREILSDFSFRELKELKSVLRNKNLYNAELELNKNTDTTIENEEDAKKPVLHLLKTLGN